MRHVIRTKYFGPHDTRPARIRASLDDKSATVNFDYGLSIEDNNRNAALALCHKLDWDCENLLGAELDSRGYMFIYISQ